MNIRCPNCSEIFIADTNQEWTVTRTIQNGIDNVVINCLKCNKGFIIDRENIFNNHSIDTNELERKKRKEQLINDGAITIAPKQSVRKKYRSEALSLLRINEIVISKTNTISDFYYSIQNVDEKHREISVEVVKTKIDFGIEELNKYQELFDKINSPKNHIKFRVSGDGLITHILNKTEIEKDWTVVAEEVKGDEYFSSFAKEDQEKIINAANEEYLNLNRFVDIINSGHTLYALLFNGFWRDYKTKENYKLRTEYKTSLLFKDINVPVELEAKMKRFDYENFIAEIEVQGVESDTFNYKQLEKIYKEAYPFANDPIEQYKYDMLATYEFDELSGVVNNFNVTVVEEAGSVEMFLDCKLKLVNEKSDTSQ